jgi:hypothetical protein
LIEYSIVFAESLTRGPTSGIKIVLVGRGYVTYGTVAYNHHFKLILISYKIDNEKDEALDEPRTGMVANRQTLHLSCHLQAIYHKDYKSESGIS